MGVLGDDISAAMFPEREPAERAWALLTEAGIASAVITDPGPFGAPTRVHVMVDRDDLETAQRIIAPLVRGDEESGSGPKPG